ncbi:MAG: Gmad2 immunoglobulin-like domain-containing protein [Anaerolineales bacterium]
MMRLLRNWIAILLMGLALPGCARATPSPLSMTEPATPATVAPSAVPPTQTPPSAPTPAPFNLATPAIVIEQPEEPIIPTLIPSSSVLPDARLAIYRPGPGSQVTSPFQIVGRGGPSYDERVHIRLLGEDGRVVSQMTTILFAYPGNAGNFATRMEFDTPAVAENARLEISTDGIRWASMDQLVSVDLVLLSEGLPRIHPVEHGPQKLAILWPWDGGVIEGGVMTVRGAGWTDSELPLTVELLNRSGEALVTHQVQLDSLEPGVLGAFVFDIAYDISYAQYVRVAIREQNADPPGLRYFSSVEVWLKP